MILLEAVLSKQEKAGSWTRPLLPAPSFSPVHREEASLPLPQRGDIIPFTTTLTHLSAFLC